MTVALRETLPSDAIAAVLEGPFRVGSERRWSVRLTDGELGIAAQLLPELARDVAVRRRYVHDVQRLAALRVPAVAAIVDHHPGTAEIPPWRVRVQPGGETLADWLTRRAPLPPDEVAALAADLADVLDRLHGAGVVVRDLHPRLVVLTEQGPVLTDIGLARIDLLSTRTAASLILEGSPYASPEQLRKTVIDQRSDLWGLGVILWQALTNTLPFGEGPSLLRPDLQLPSLAELCPGLPRPLSDLVHACLREDPEERPGSAREVGDVLRGASRSPTESTRTTCQNCGASLRLGQRLCVSCGREAVQFSHAPDDADNTSELVLTRIKEDADQLSRLDTLLRSVAGTRIPKLNFLIGDRRMYSKQERLSRLPLPLVLFDQLDSATARALAGRFQREGLAVKVRRTTAMAVPKYMLASAIAVLALDIVLAVKGVLSLVMAGVSFSLFAIVVLAGWATRVKRKRKRLVLLRLREGPAALPASDPLVARLAAHVHEHTPTDVRERVGELALLVQRLVDHRARLRHDAADEGELQMLTEPIDPLVTLVEREVERVARIDRELQELDEGALVRGLAVAQARGADASQQETILHALDRLRVLEDERAAAGHRLLEASSLLRRAVELGLRVGHEHAEHERHIALALAALQ